MKFKIIAICLIPFVIFFAVLPVTTSAAAAGAIVTAGEAMTAMEIFDFLVDSGLVEVDQLGTYFTPSLLLRTASGFLDSFGIPIESAPEFVQRLVNANNQIFWSNDKTGAVQLHNGEYVPLDSPSDIWYISDHINDNPYIPVNANRQSNGIPGTYDSYTPEFIDIYTNNNPAFDSIYMLPICTNSGNTYYSSQMTLFSFVGNSLYYGVYSTANIDTVLKNPSLLRTMNPGSPDSLRAGYSSDSFSRFYYWFTHGIDPYDWDRSTIHFDSLSNKFSWYSSSSGTTSDVSSGDISFLIYYSKPILAPADMPDGDFVYSDNPDDVGDTVIISPDGEFGNLFDFLVNGFKFTGKIEATIDNKITFSGNVSADINANHSGSVNISINYPDQQFWAEDGSATDFGNGITLDGNSFNDGFSWLIDSVKAVPAVLASFAFIPAPVIAVMSAALVCMVFLGFWRTFKGGS